ncbi:MAG: hypothetical protein OEU74_06065 [Gammaproteobacteria bacterium]|nr:hypothetical protein [Gammaproteobacteria bacterium]
MNLCLILGTKPASQDAEIIWRDACQNSGVTLEVVNPDNTQYQTLVEQLQLNTFPALIQNDRVLAIGIPTPESAKKLLTELAADRSD